MNIRKELNFPLTKVTISDILGISVSTYMRWEKGGVIIPEAPRVPMGRKEVRAYDEAQFLALLEHLSKKTNDNGALWFPWLEGFDKNANGSVLLTPSGYEIVL